MRFHKLDLNLLVVLDALLKERSVSLASERVHLSQSATSSALGRLREYFEDDLLVLQGRNMVLTTRGEQLLDPVSAVLDNIRTTIAVTPPFDPARSDRTISIMASDYTLEVLFSRALRQFAEEAPLLRFEIFPLGDDLVQELERGVADLLITIDTAISTEHPWEALYDDDFVVVGWTGNTTLNDSLSKEAYEQLGHITVQFGKQRVPSFEEWALRSKAIDRRIEVIAPNFSSVPGLLVGSDRIATMHRRLAMRMARILPLRIVEVPLEIPKIRQAVQWAQHSSGDPALMWVVQRLKQIAGQADL